MPTKPRFLGGFPPKPRSVLRNRQGIPRLSGVSSRAHEAGMRENVPPHNSIVPRDTAPVPRYTSPSAPRVASRSPGLELLQKPDRSSATRTGHIICYRHKTVEIVEELQRVADHLGV